MKKIEYKNAVFCDEEPSNIKMFVRCAICGDGIEFLGLPVFPICDNCLKIFREFVANHKSKWEPGK